MSSCYPLTPLRTNKLCSKEYVSQQECMDEAMYNYRMSLNVTEPCKATEAPLGEICRGSNVPACEIDANSSLRPILTRYKYTRQPSTMLMGTAPYKARGEGLCNPDYVDLESRMFMGEGRPQCLKRYVERGVDRFEILPPGTVTSPVEDFRIGGEPTRCAQYAYSFRG